MAGTTSLGIPYWTGTDPVDLSTYFQDLAEGADEAITDAVESRSPIQLAASTSSGTVSFASLAATYEFKRIEVVAGGVVDTGGTGRIRLNGVTTTDYRWHYQYTDQAGASTQADTAGTGQDTMYGPRFGTTRWLTRFDIMAIGDSPVVSGVTWSEDSFNYSTGTFGGTLLGGGNSVIESVTVLPPPGATNTSFFMQVFGYRSS